MNCPHCGTANDANDYRCTSCSRVIQADARAAAAPELGDSAVMRMLLPVGRSGWAIAAGYAGLFALLIVPGPVALLLGIVAVRDLRRHPRKHGMGRAVFGIVAGAVATVVLVWMLVTGQNA